MTNARVWILFEPAIYADLFQGIFEGLERVEVIRTIDPGDHPANETCLQEGNIDVIVLPLDEQGQPRTEMLPDLDLRAKVVAFSPDGKRGLRRLPGENCWEEMRPFGLADLLFEVLKID